MGDGPYTSCVGRVGVALTLRVWVGAAICIEYPTGAG